MQKKIVILVIIIIALVSAYLIYNNKNINNDLLVTSINSNYSNLNNVSKDILENDGVKHSVPLDDIVDGGPEKDGIPSIDNPIFIPIEEADKYVNDSESGIAVMMGGINRFYPYQILVYHEIVNDTINGQRILITYCPLCQSGLVFDPLVQGERVEFGVSGKLWNSNLVMYDRKTNSLWSQALGKAIVGEMTDTVLEVLPFDLIKYGNWKKDYPDGEVLSRDTGALEYYGYDPYGDYYSSPGVAYPLDNEDNRLEQKQLILGLLINNHSKAYLPSAVKKVGKLEENIGGEKVIIEYVKDIQSIRVFKKMNNNLERINPVFMYWFVWSSIHPDTELFK